MNFALRPSSLLVIATLAVISFAFACSSGSPTESSPTAAVSPTATVSPEVEPTATPEATAEPDEAALPPAAIDRIAYSTEEGIIYTINADGSDRRQVNPNLPSLPDSVLGDFYEWPSWSPDGRYLLMTAFTADIAGGYESSLLRIAAARPGSLPELVFRDVPGTTGIGGVAHFALWHPDGESVVVIANTGNNLSTFTVNFEGEIGVGISNGGPVYVDWSSDGSYMLSHTNERLALHTFDPETGSRTSVEPIGGGSVSYRVPSFSPVSDDFLYVDTIDGNRSLVLSSVIGLEPEPLLDAGSSTAFRWSPDGELIAYGTGTRSGVYDLFTVFAPGDDEVAEPIEQPIRAFWWSPDGGRLLLATQGAVLESVLLQVYEIGSGELRTIGEIEPSPEMGFVIEFFDQYAADVNLWSPDSSSFVFSGIPGDGLPDGNTRIQLGDGISGIWVYDALGKQPPTSPAAGVFATWTRN